VKIGTSFLKFLVTLFVLRVLMAYHAELNFGIIWSICTLQSIVLWRHNPRNFVSDKLAINLFSYCNLPFISQPFLKNDRNLVFSKFINYKFTINQLFHCSYTTLTLSLKSKICEAITITLVSSGKSIGQAF